jgi:uncharacterized membrane protein
MELINELLLHSGQWTQPHLHNITLALMATLLVIYGNDINRLVKSWLKSYPRLIRLIGFVLMCAFGYGALTVLLTPLLANWLTLLSVKWLAPMVVATFLLVGWLAERKHQL